MTRLVTASVICLLALGAAVTVVAGSATRGSSDLSIDPDVRMYKEADNGVPNFVSGNLSAPVARGLEIQTAIAFFENHKADFKMKEPALELVLDRVDEDELGIQHVRFQQFYHGIRVYGAELLAHYTAEGQLQTINGSYQPGIDLNTHPSIGATEATDIALADLLTFFGTGAPDNPELIVYPWEGEYYLCWHFTLWSNTPMGRWEYFMDAKTGDVLFKANRIMSQESIGSGYGVMWVWRDHIDTWYTGSIYEMTDYTRQANNDIHGHNGQMPDGNYIQTNEAEFTLPGTVATDDNNVWDNTSVQGPAVDANLHTSLMYDWMLSVFGRNSFDNAGSTMLSSVNYIAEGTNNAYWNGIQIVVWGWAGNWRSMACAPDIIAHEWGHAITDYTSDLIYQKESGALNEAFSDMIGAAFEFAHDSIDTPDWLIGENATLSGNGFRSMSDPTQFNDPDYYGTSPFWIDVENCTPSGGNDYCGVHTNSGVGNKWFYLLSDGGTFHDVTVTDIGVENAIQIAYRANVYYWTANSDYSDAAFGTIVAADDLDLSGVWSTEVENAWTAVGVTIPPPALVFDYPAELPNMVAPGDPSPVAITVEGIYNGIPVSSSGQLHYAIDGGSAQTVAMTETSPGYYETTLPALFCNQTLEFYFSVEETTSGTFYEPDPGSPHELFPVTDTFTVVTNNLDIDPGWTTEGDWAFGQPTGGGGTNGGPDPTSGYTGLNVYGYNLEGDYPDDLSEKHLTSTAFDLSGQYNTHLRFWRWLGVEHSIYDHAYVRVSVDGSDWTTVWENDDYIIDDSWVQMDIDISDVADNQPTVYLRWTMGTTDGGWRSCGWNIDDIQIVSHGCGCCDGERGNVQLEPSCDPADQTVDISDLTNMIDHLFIGYDPICCVDEADIAPMPPDPSDGVVDIADLTAMIDHLFISYPSLPSCM